MILLFKIKRIHKELINKIECMLQYHPTKQSLSILTLILALVCTSASAQNIKRVSPKWWFGESIAVNYNNYGGTTQKLNNALTVPTAFHKGSGFRPYASILAEYRPGKVFGGMLNLAYDNRGGTFNEVTAPCNCPATLATNISYVSIEPSLRLAPFSSAFYVFAGPTISINLSRNFTYEQQKQATVKEDLSDMRKTMIAAQAGLGIDIPLSAKNSASQTTLSPFASFQTNLFQGPRTIETWAVHTFRAGIALKFGKGKVTPEPVVVPEAPVAVVAAPIIVEKEIQFTIRAPKVVPLNRQVREIFPMRSTVFFNTGSTIIPDRYVLLSPTNAQTFRESQLQEGQPENLNKGRSSRQMNVYYNILNITGDRMRSNVNTSITLTGASDNNPVEGKQMAENVKQYLVVNYSIDPTRIITVGRDKPVVPSEQPGGTKELGLLREGDRRVDITSDSPELLLQVGGKNTGFFRPVEINTVQQDPLDNHVIFYNTGATETLDTWTVVLTDEQGVSQTYGPYTQDQASVSGKTILGANRQGNYKIVMIGKSKKGVEIRKDSYVSLMRMDEVKQEGLRYSILFDFDKSTANDNYEKFLFDIIEPLIKDNGTVIIHGHTDIIGEEKHNLELSRERAKETQRILEKALISTGKKGVRFETYGFGEDAGMAPFENNLPEERFYNRSVIIDIIPAN